MGPLSVKVRPRKSLLRRALTIRGVYEASLLCSAVTTDRTLLYLTAPSGKTVEVLSAAITDASNTTNAQIEGVIQKITTLGSPTGTSITPTKTEQGDQASGSTVVGNITGSEPSYTAGVLQGHEGFSNLGGWYYSPIPEERMYIAGGDSWGIRILDTVPSSTDFVVRIRYREIG